MNTLVAFAIASAAVAQKSQGEARKRATYEFSSFFASLSSSLKCALSIAITNHFYYKHLRFGRQNCRDCMWHIKIFSNYGVHKKTIGDEVFSSNSAKTFRHLFAANRMAMPKINFHEINSVLSPSPLQSSYASSIKSIAKSATNTFTVCRVAGQYNIIDHCNR